ncbi:MAG TPA: hypothetical protein VK797_25380 [Tepidisphaeraceae bacterium]|nr:hypothetical protein [Tepidisphaeraceae bacterium]
MSDRFVSQIRIGGLVNQPTLQRLIAAAKRDAAKTEWDGEHADEPSFHAAIATNQPLRFYDSEASAWQFENLERFCQEKGLSFQRHRAAGHDCDAEFLYWAPGMQQPRCARASQDGNEVLVSLTELEEALQVGDSLAQVVRQARTALRDIPPLQLLEDGTAAEHS